jgi:hypothetical protein
VKNGESPCVELQGETGAEYILSIDPNVASNVHNDHFAMSVLKINRETQSGILVHQYARAGVDYSEYIEYLLFLITHFNIVYLNMDSMGGEQFIEACNNSHLFKQNNIHLGFIQGDFDSPEKLREIKKTYNVTNKVYCYSQKFLSSWIRAANEHLQSCIDAQNRKIWFASKLAFHHSFRSNLSLNLPVVKVDSKIHADKEAAMLDFIEWQDSWMDMVKKQCSLVETKTTSLGQLNFDIPQHLKKSTKADRARKDSYSALLLNMWGLKQFFEIESAPNTTKEMFVPFFIG